MAADFCKFCREEIAWVEMRETGKKMPIDRDPQIIVVIDKSDGKAKVVTGFRSHFATCPGADIFRK